MLKKKTKFSKNLINRNKHLSLHLSNHFHRKGSFHIHWDDWKVFVFEWYVSRYCFWQKFPLPIIETVYSTQRFGAWVDVQTLSWRLLGNTSSNAEFVWRILFINWMNSVKPNWVWSFSILSGTNLHLDFEQSKSFTTPLMDPKRFVNCNVQIQFTFSIEILVWM